MAYRTSSPRIRTACSGREQVIDALAYHGVTSILDIDVNPEPVAIMLAAQAYTADSVDTTLMSNALLQIIVAQEREIGAAVRETDNLPTRSAVRASATSAVAVMPILPVPSSAIANCWQNLQAVVNRAAGKHQEARIGEGTFYAAVGFSPGRSYRSWSRCGSDLGRVREARCALHVVGIGVRKAKDVEHAQRLSLGNVDGASLVISARPLWRTYEVATALPRGGY